MPPVETIDVYVAEDRGLIRSALVALLSLEEGIRVVGESGCREDVVDDILRLDPAVAVLNVRLDGLCAAAILRGKAPHVRVLMLTGGGRSEDFRRAVDAGVQGFMAEDASAHRVAEAIRALARGERVIDVELADDAPPGDEPPGDAAADDAPPCGAPPDDPEPVARPDQAK